MENKTLISFIFITLSMIFITLSMILTVDGLKRKEPLGSLHTATAFIDPLIKIETEVVEQLSNYVEKEEKKLQLIKKYINDFTWEDPSVYQRNPLGSFHLFKRMKTEFDEVRKEIMNNNSFEVLESIDNLRGPKSDLPTNEDISGIAWALVHLQDVYDVPVDHLVDGRIKNTTIGMELGADDCLMFSERGFENLAFKASERWTSKALQILHSRTPVSRETKQKIEFVRQTVHRREMMKELVTTMVKKTDNKVYGHIAGFGVPKSFETEIWDKPDMSNIMGYLDEYYKLLCRADITKNHLDIKNPKCFYSPLYSNIPNTMILPKPQSAPTYLNYKKEVVAFDPEIIVYYDVISDKEIEMIQEYAFPLLKTAEVKPYVNVTNRQSIARIGKSAWIKRREVSFISKIIKRLQGVTGLSTKYAEELHVLNYGVGGHYELHIDFFDFIKRNNSQNKWAYRGDQVATILFYLNDVEYGGSTVFPLINTGVKPKKGSIAVWYNLYQNGTGHLKSMHAACPILLGQKWIATIWLPEQGQEYIRPCLLDKNI